jgi:hypothetical protein
MGGCGPLRLIQLARGLLGWSGRWLWVCERHRWPLAKLGHYPTFHFLEIRVLGGKMRRPTMVRVVDQIAALLEENVIGTFFFWALPGERRLWCLARADGPRSMDLETMQRIIEAAD